MSKGIAAHLRGNVVGYVAVFLALCGGAYAAGLPKNSVKSKQIKDGQVLSADIGDNAVTGADVDESTLSLEPGPRGATGPQGPQGATGPAGAPGADGSPDTSQQVLAKLLGVDGTGSTLDADLLDGQSSSAFLGAGAKAADADQLDGLNSTAYKTGTIGRSSPGFGGSQVAAASVSGVGDLRVRCGTTGGGDAGVPKVLFHNSSGGTARVITAEVAGISNAPGTVPSGAFVGNGADSTELLGPTTLDAVSHVVYWVNTSGSAAQVRWDVIGINQTSSGCTFLFDVTENAP
jgi:hypothetical protein